MRSFAVAVLTSGLDRLSSVFTTLGIGIRGALNQAATPISCISPHQGRLLSRSTELMLDRMHVVEEKQCRFMPRLYPSMVIQSMIGSNPIPSCNSEKKSIRSVCQDHSHNQRPPMFCLKTCQYTPNIRPHTPPGT